jgi:hypothetical protein
MINRNAYKSLLESVQEAVAPIEETDSLWLSRKQGAKKAVKPMAEEEEDQWDEIDEILAEGIEMYGEDGLVEILADFAETGELSEELVDVLEATGFDPMELARRLNNNTHADYLAQFNAPSASIAKQTGMASRTAATRMNKPGFKSATAAKPSLKSTTTSKGKVVRTSTAVKPSIRKG